ncbi:CheR family methyltransferase [Deminuibacter soli]|uniref:Protein-glutamate O-methyltransferase CheR n=1 Tax=Deminuibacter soli TaxID=2291815 RepID=A0A3E1NIK7_9BACT|nr:protein-glutamate O-methyltransferase CheR [Deminuibacter soli]RFM27752.1 protein-glutamate O-methyltransferase CheR [Deminuibacter soli]
MEGNYVKDDEVELLLSDLLDAYGYDFTNYARASIKRRINRLFLLDRFPSFAEMRYRVKNDPDYLRRVVEQISVNVTEMFRDPAFYKTLRNYVLPMLATRPSVKIWHAGCATGEEVYSMAILLKEAGLLHKSLLYATDINPVALEKARKGIFPISEMKYYSENYILSGGKSEFSSYYTAQYNWAKFDETLSRRMILATHNLVSDSSFNEFQLIICRNVLIYFDKVLQDKVFKLFDASLESLGYLALGSKETLRFSSIVGHYRQIENREKIWKKVK